MVEEWDRTEPRHFGTLTKKLGLSAPSARRTRPQKMSTMCVHRSIVGKGPFVCPLPLGIAYRRSVAPPDPTPDTVWMKSPKHNQEVELCYAGKK
ncbi:hypothetical protein DFP93_105130 [Aneurinibacillus soli]|uniref:Uncharacterized protein n=1 Tax=Aneurinibacillus soli TaxID=1500254 RepID=A0A0U5BCH2_9BACL|nr:hypothetical protein [Aneurinibacillus soli]PYE62176.1 hypothetical protein DFP93_105130 [Aneurinibacillus soli]BAU28636.1 hypothetical protein CB4_02811 [Aneurinibacillus soli]